MSLTRRKDGRWVKSKTINGERVFFYSIEKSEKKALRDIESQMVSYQGKIERGKTFQEVADEWEEVHYKSISPTTEVRYEQYVKSICDEFGEQGIKEITLNDLVKFLEYMSMRGLSTKTIKDCSSVMRLIFKFAVTRGYIDYTSNPTLFLTPPKGTPPVTRQPLTKEEISAVIRKRNSEIGKLMFFCLYSGLRKGEALALQWSDIDFKKKLINVDKSMYYVGSKPQIKSTKTKAGTRKVILLDALCDEIKKWKRESIYVFTDHGQTYTNGSIQKRIIAYCKTDPDLAKVTLHRLRHTFCTMLYEFGVDIKDAQTIMGHSDIITTQNIYTHVRDTKLEKTALMLNQQINKSSEYGIKF
nr:MAG TPA: Integrase [Caudoviricetes sp.]